MVNNMDPERDLEKMEDMEEHPLPSGTSTLYSELDKPEDEEKRRQEMNGEPDINHDEVEEMDAGHQADLRRQHVYPAEAVRKMTY
jgi:hypothetical protein